ncbi:uncharacterized protein [Periplaneta americana]|uniref:uncharacterized protein isoform X3 n=1 Tax=Periplaneta americana TaxID=6978 RepID=UPI0037E8A7EF
MDVIKMEPALDLLDIQLHDNTYELEGNDPLSEEGNLSHVDVTGMKTECVDKSYNFKSEIKVEDTTPVAISLPMVKTEVDEDFFDVDRVQREQKVEVSSEKDEVLTESCRQCPQALDTFFKSNVLTSGMPCHKTRHELA